MRTNSSVETIPSTASIITKTSKPLKFLLIQLRFTLTALLVPSKQLPRPVLLAARAMTASTPKAIYLYLFKVLPREGNIELKEN